MTAEGKVRVAIACQGGGAQTAFTAGVLTYLLKTYAHQNGSKQFDIVALSGTSGGAVCASLAWDDLLFAGRLKDDTYRPKVERFWKTGYPDGNASLPLPVAMVEDLMDFVMQGRLPWLRTVDRLRAELGMVGLQEPSLLTGYSPFDAVFELKPYFFNDMFERIDETALPLLLNPLFDMVGSELRRLRAVPGCLPMANLIGDLLDLSPLHGKSVIREGERAIIRRECDIQDAFRALLKKYFTDAEIEELHRRVAKARENHEVLPELLIGAADAQQVHDAAGNRLRLERLELREKEHAKREPVAGGLSADQIKKAKEEGEKAKAEALRLEEHTHHLACYTNFRILRGTENIDTIVDSVIASAAIPTVMRGVEKDQTTLWDGLYSSNPPIYDLPDIHGSTPDDQDRNPEQIWVVRINPTQMCDRPDTVREIVDRRNELAGNLPLTQEIRNVIQIGGAWKGNRYYRPITFGFIDMSEDVAAMLDYPTKLDKRLESIEMLFDDGYRQAERFYERWAA
jgi:predicted acylesterase/phospholipase RssA